jgi:hypothetical protein
VTLVHTADAGDAGTIATLPPSIFRDLVMSAADCRRTPRDSVSHADALADVAVVERIVRRGWRAGLAKPSCPRRAMRR